MEYINIKSVKLNLLKDPVLSVYSFAMYCIVL